jgi:hypothetical protein
MDADLNQLTGAYMKPLRQQVSGEDENQGHQGYDTRAFSSMGLASLCLRTSSTSSFPGMVASLSIG